MAESLKHKTIKGVSWTFGETLVSYFIRFFIGIILARLLSPTDFGLIGMIMIFISISEVFIDAGFGQAFIYKKDADNRDADTIFLINLIISIFIYAILYFSAPLISKFFSQNELTSLIRVLALVVIINSANVIQYAIIRKELLFKKRALITISASLLSGIIGIGCAYKGFGVWSLVIQQIGNRLIACLLLYINSNWKYSFGFSKESFRELFSYGSWVLFANIVCRFFQNIYKLFIGKLFPPAQLGYYERASQFEAMISQTFTMVFGTVAFPVLAKLNPSSNNNELERSVFKFIYYSVFIIYPLLGCLFVTAEPLITFLITDKWLPAVPYLKSLCFAGFMYPIYFYIAPMVQAVGKAKLVFYFTIFISLLRVINVGISYRLGINAIIIGEFFVLLIFIIGCSLYLIKIIGFNYLKIFSELKWLMVIFTLTMLSACGIAQLLENQTALIRIFIPSLTLIILFVTLNIIFQKKTHEIFKFATQLFKSR